MASLRMERFAECGNLLMFCKIISDRQQIPCLVRQGGRIKCGMTAIYIFGSSLPTCLMQIGLRVLNKC
jgi:hypothetical protein